MIDRGIGEAPLRADARHQRIELPIEPGEQVRVEQIPDAGSWVICAVITDLLARLRRSGGKAIRRDHGRLAAREIRMARPLPFPCVSGARID